jgi:hypothetical protein
VVTAPVVLDWPTLLMVLYTAPDLLPAMLAAALLTSWLPKAWQALVLPPAIMGTTKNSAIRTTTTVAAAANGFTG